MSGALVVKLIALWCKLIVWTHIIDALRELTQ
jgi:hypothetical protein